MRRPTTRPRRGNVPAAAALVLALALTGCSGTEGDPAAKAASSASPTPRPTRSAAPSPAPTDGSDAVCTVEYVVTSEWEGQFQADVTLTVLDAAVTSWSLGWTFADGQTVSQLWNGDLSQDGGAVTVGDAGHNAAVARGASTSFGFIASWTTANTVPTEFTLDGRPCSGPAAAPSPGPSAPPTTPAPSGTAPAQPAAPAAGSDFYLNPATQAAAAAQGATGEDRALLDKIASTPQAFWVGSWTDASQSAASLADYTARAAAAGQVPLVVVYAIPGRDCGSYSGGGLAEGEYTAWVDTVAAAVVGEPWIVLEPDALAQLGDCAGQGDRIGHLQHAAQRFTEAGGHVYVDAGHPAWLTARETASRLSQVGFAYAEGFALNTSNYQSTAASRAYGEKISALVGGKPFVVDTARNGQGPLGTDWCNAAGRGLGERPHLVDDGTHLSALLWVKPPGESDGTCNGGPAAGQWWPESALELARNASW